MMMSAHAFRPAPGARFRSMPVEIFRRLASSIPGMRHLTGQWLQEEELFETFEQSDTRGMLSPVPLLITMKDRKVYVGVLENTPSFTAGAFTHVNLVVLPGLSRQGHPESQLHRGLHESLSVRRYRSACVQSDSGRRHIQRQPF